MGFSRPIWEEVEPFATDEDYAECARLHRQHGTTYYFASRRLPLATRRRVDAVYGFVRVPDEWVDNPNADDIQPPAERLQHYRQEMLAATYGRRPTFGVLRAFCDVLRECQMPLEEPLQFLDSMESDLTVNRYETYDQLRHYMRGSAVSVGIMMLYVLNANRDAATREAATALGEAMQLTNFLRDIGEDLTRGRIYIPQEDLTRFGVSESELRVGEISRPVVELMRFQIARARALYERADLGIQDLPDEMRFGVTLARELYSKILDKIEEANYDVFRTRLRTSPQEKMVVAWRIWSTNST